MDVIDIAQAIVSRAMHRIDVSGQNLANMTTPGYKARTPFADMIAATGVDGAAAPQGAVDFSNGKLHVTGNPFDLAISGEGFFAVRAGGTEFYTRNGQFHRDADGHLVTPEGLALQAAGGDVTVAGANVVILEDGTVLDDNQPVARLRIGRFDNNATLTPAGAGLFRAVDAPGDVTEPQVRQGALETSNVSSTDEMIAVMAALRNAESGQHIVQTYNDLMERAIATFGQL